MAIRCVKDRISRTELKALSGDDLVETIKVVADIEKRIIAFEIGRASCRERVCLYV